MPRVTACATLGYAAFDLSTALDRIAQRGFRVVEITELNAYCRHFPHRQADAARVGRELKRRGLTVVAMNVSTSRVIDGRLYRPRMSDPREAEGVRNYAEFFFRGAARLGVKILTFTLGPRLLEGDWRAEMRMSVAGFRGLVDAAAELGVGLNIEVPHLYQLADSVDRVAEVFEAIDRPSVGATVDSSHWGILGYDLDDFLGRLGPRLRHVHLRDSAGVDTRNDNLDLERTPGDGQVDFAAFGQALDRTGYAGSIALEFEHRHTGLDAIELQFDRGIAHLRTCGWAFPPTV